jgi:hypothetical protein
MFQAAVVALEKAGFHRETWSHAALQATFTTQLIHRRKLYAQSLAQYLKRRAQQLFAWAKAFVSAVEEVTGRESP